MENSIRFIHAADIHLGSFLHLSNKVEGDFKSIIDNAVFSAFERIINAAIDNAVDFVVISGDIFEGDKRSISTDNFFYTMMKKLNDIEVFIICGNHDPYREWKEIFKLSQNVHIIPCDEVEKFNFIKSKTVSAQIEGISYRTKKEGRNIIEKFKYNAEGIPGIALLHTQLDNSNDSYMPASVSDLMNVSNISYWALGHIHKLKVINENKPCIVYPGIPQGRDFGEEGIGGCLLVEIDNKAEVSLKYVPVSSVVFKKIDINIEEYGNEELQDLTDVEDLIIDKGKELVIKDLKKPQNLHCESNIENVIKGFVVQWVIKGRGKVHTLISGKEDDIGALIASNVNERLKGLNGTCFMHTDSVLFRTSDRLPDINELMNASPIYEELKGTLEQCSENENFKKELLDALGDIWKHNGDIEDEDPFKFCINDEILTDIMKQAQELIIEKLYARRADIED